MSWDWGGMGGQHRSAANPGGGLPFAGVPEEMRPGVERLVAREPEHPEAEIRFNYASAPSGSRLTLRALLFEHWRLGVASSLLVGVIAITNQIGPKLITEGIDRGMLGSGGMTVIGVVSGLYVASVVAGMFATRSLARVSGRLAANVMNELRIRIFTQLQRLGLDFYTAEKAGVVMTRMTSDIENLQQLLQDGLAQIAVQVITMIVITAVLFSMNVELAAITIAITVPPLTVMSLWFRSRSEWGYLRVRDGIANVLADLSESLHGIRVVTAHNRQQHNVIHHRNVVGEYRDANMYTAQITAVYGPGTQLLGYLGQAALLGIGGDKVVHHSLSIGELVAFFLYLNRFFGPIQLLVQQYNVVQQSRSSLVKLRQLLATAPNVTDGPEQLPAVEGEIEFRNVNFSYGGNVPVLSDVNLRINAGETVAFVGPTGGGKSTLAKLVSRFYDPSSGEVLLDGRDARAVTLASLRRQVGVVPQEPFLFDGTLRDNVTFARPSATDEEVADAIEEIGLSDLVERLPEGLDTPVHERGQSLSSGERQLIALARAFIARPRVLVLDEATSNLDLRSESLVEAALDRLLEGRTAILIAHRLTTAMKADRIVVIEAGRVVESGSHAELVARGGSYAAMYDAWSAQGTAA